MSFWTELKRALSRDTPAFKDRPSLTPDTAIDIVRSTGNHALADEMQRGRDRASSRVADEARLKRAARKYT